MTDYIERTAALNVNFKISTRVCESKLIAARKAVQEYANEIAKIPAADVRPVKWIPVTERLPETGERVLCYCRANIYEVMKMRTDGDWVYDTNHIYMHSFVTHWMPLPEPPTAEGGE